jgi:hypothetical protein
MIQRKRAATNDFLVELPPPPSKKQLFFEGPVINETDHDDGKHCNNEGCRFCSHPAAWKAYLGYGLGEDGKPLKPQYAGTLLALLPRELIVPPCDFATGDLNLTKRLGEFLEGCSYWDGWDWIESPVHPILKRVSRATPAPLPDKFITHWPSFRAKTGVCLGWVTRDKPCLNKLQLDRQPTGVSVNAPRKYTSAAHKPHRFHESKSGEYFVVCGYCAEDIMTANSIGQQRCHAHCKCHKPGAKPCKYGQHHRPESQLLGEIFNLYFN